MDAMGELGVDVERLRAADPEGLYLFMMRDCPYMMTPDQVAEFRAQPSYGLR